MATQKIEATSTADREIVITRLLNAPRELVFKAWTDPQQVVRWWGPTGFTTTTHEMNVHPGGVWRFTMHGPDGVDYPNRATFIDIKSPERLEYTHGSDVDPDPHAFHVTVTFEERGGKTEITMRSLFPTAADLDRVVREFHAIEGAHQHLDRLSEHLAKLDAVALKLSRTFDAPRDLVFKACTEADRLAQWWGPKGSTVLSCTQDLREGGGFHYALKVSNLPDVLWGKFIYHEIAPPERLVFTNCFSDEQGGVTRNPWDELFPLEILYLQSFTENDGKTTIETTGIPYGATEAETENFAKWNASMTQGFAGTFDQLEAFLAKH